MRILFGRFMPVGVILNLALVGMLCVLAAMQYLHLELSLSICLLSLGIIGGIYLLNRYTDLNEDFANDTARMIFLMHKNTLYPIGITLLIVSGAFLVLDEKITPYHFILLFTGVAYSFPLIPWYKRNKGLLFVKLKQIPLVKNVTVALLWGFSIFLIPVLFTQTRLTNWSTVALLISAQILATLSNTLFSDIRDEVGDRIAGNMTLPVMAGPIATYVTIVAMNSAWILFSLALYVLGLIDSGHFFFFLLVALYPAVYICAYHIGQFSKGVIDILGDLQLLLFAGGLFVLSQF
jgi:4-hydroxybenzoate polyprenyltransferase